MAFAATSTRCVPAESVVVAGPAWVGDMVMAQALLRVLRRASPGIAIDVLAPPGLVPLVERMPEVRQAIALPNAHGSLDLRSRWRLGRDLRTRRYTRAIVLPRSWKSALVPWVAGASQRTGFDTELRYGLLNDRRPLDRQRLDQTVKRFVALGLPAGAPLPEIPPPQLRIDAANRARLLGDAGLTDRAPPVALLPGAAFGSAKRWPAAQFAELARKLADAGAAVLVLGSADERALGESVAGGDPRIQNLCGCTTLADTVDWLSACRAAVTNDSGLLHVAAAAGTHVIGLYGSSSPAFTPPLTDRRTIHYLGLSCSPCFARDCPLGHLDCLRRIAPDDVLRSVNALS